jgi:peptidoglycan/xylan/chitin deacetylase (PgdA/CDA1 family)
MWPATAAIAASGAAAGFLAWAVRGRSAQILAPSVWRLPPGRRQVALTFDDGPSESTPALLDLLARHNARATFFVCGHNARRLPQILKQIHAAGHEIGNHTFSHPRLDFTSPARMRDEISRTQQIIGGLTGQTPTLFRAPYGVRWFGLGAVQKEFGLTGVMWTAIGRDWTLPGPAIAARLQPHMKDGHILCLHDGRVLAESPDITPTLDAMTILLPALRQGDLSSAPVSEMLER